MTENEKNLELQEIITILFNKKVRILALSFLISISFYSLSFLINDQFTSTSLLRLSDTDEQSSSSSALGSLSKVGGLAGFNMGGKNQDAYYAMETFKSRDFFKHLTNVDNKLLTYLEFPDTFPIAKISIPPENKMLHQQIYKDIYLQNFNVNYDEETGFIRLQFTHQSPDFAYNFLSLVIQEINNIAKKRDLIKTDRALSYLEQKITSSNQMAVKQSIAFLIESQLNKQMLANVDDYYLLSPIDLPHTPYQKSYPSRLLVLIISFLVSISLISLYYISKPLIRLNR
jgi:LPS O-antigen subunit length determinant protein (WzzB/FepE family)